MKKNMDFEFIWMVEDCDLKFVNEWLKIMEIMKFIWMV